MHFLLLDKDGNAVNRIVASEEFVSLYCDKHGYAYELLPDIEEAEPFKHEPTLDERVSALEDSNAEMAEALDLLLSGVTE